MWFDVRVDYVSKNKNCSSKKPLSHTHIENGWLQDTVGRYDMIPTELQAGKLNIKQDKWFVLLRPTHTHTRKTQAQAWQNFDQRLPNISNQLQIKHWSIIPDHAGGGEKAFHFPSIHRQRMEFLPAKGPASRVEMPSVAKKHGVNIKAVICGRVPGSGFPPLRSRALFSSSNCYGLFT